MKEPINRYGLDKDNVAVYIHDLENRKEVFKCPYCSKKLFVRKNDENPHYPLQFVHEKNADCIVQGYLKEEIDDMDRYIKRGESQRHKELKRNVLIWLKNQGITDVVEEKTIFDNNFFRRRPDVFCKFNGKRIAFEVQTSKLSYKMLEKRSKFFEDNQIYCIWLVDEFIKNRDQLARDYQYIHKKENVFVPILKNNEFKLMVHYIQPTSKDIEKWEKRIIKQLSSLHFDESYCVYFYDTPTYRSKVLEQISLTNRQLVYEEKQKEDFDKLRQQTKNYAQMIIDFKFANENQFMNELLHFLSAIPKSLQEEFFILIQHESYSYKGYYEKPFLNSMVYENHIELVEILLRLSLPIKLNVDGVDESGIDICQQLIGVPDKYREWEFDYLISSLLSHSNNKNKMQALIDRCKKFYG